MAETFQWTITDRTHYESKGLRLGIKHEEIAEWIKDKAKVFEIGPGGGNMFTYLFQQGVDIETTEPSIMIGSTDGLTLKGLGFSASAMANGHSFINRVTSMRAQARVYNFMAENTPPELIGKYDYVFAIGMNFLDHSYNENNALRQLAGALALLKPSGQSWLSFTCSFDGDFLPPNLVKLNLFKLLSYLDLNYTIVNIGTEGPSIRIFSKANEAHLTVISELRYLAQSDPILLREMFCSTKKEKEYFQEQVQTWT